MRRSSYSFIDIEKKWLNTWEQNNLNERYLNKNAKSDKTFSFFDGPITANNPMGVHHAWGRSYKDLWQKFYNLLGYKQRFQNGFDCQGLWVEVEVEKQLGLNSKKDIKNLVPGDEKASIAKFVQLCKDRVEKFSKLQTSQSKRLAYFMDWENSYYTMSDENNYMIWHFIKECHEHGWIYKGKDCVPWCPRCGTAISQHEILSEDYAEVTHESVFFKLEIENPEKHNLPENTHFLVWTTTPWTIPGNVALAVNKELEYQLVEVTLKGSNQSHCLVLAKSLVEKVFKKDSVSILKSIYGKDLIGISYVGAFDELPLVQEAKHENPSQFHRVYDGGLIVPVSEEEGTGIVHIAPAAGQEDFKLAKEYKMPVICLIDEDASYIDRLSTLSRQNAKDKPGLIFNHLKTYREGQFFLKTQSYRHRYPRCWRCKTELVWRVVDEWYIAMDVSSKKLKNDTRTLRERMIDVAKKISWIPSFGLDRELDWLNNMHDWLISKKRFWGLALPIWISEDGEEFEVIGSKEELEKRSQSGWENFKGHSPHKPYIDEVVITSEKTGKPLYRIPDVGNVWLDAGIIPFSTILDPETKKLAYIHNKEYFNKWFPAQFITESFPGQFKNWFYSLIAMSTVLENTNSFETVLGFSTLLAEDGRAMHKSWGNSIEFQEGADLIGVDVMRWMYARQNPSDNMLFGYKKADEIRRSFYIVLWNVYRFFEEYSTLDSVTQKNLDKVNISESSNVLDQWILTKLVDTEALVKKSFLQYDAKTAALSLENFVADLSTWYLRRSRERVWLQAKSEQDKLYFYATTQYILKHIAIIISPIVPFLSEEIYTNLTGYDSVHLSDWPDLKINSNQKLRVDMETVRLLAEYAHRLRKEQKIKVRQPLNQVTLELPKSMKFQISDNQDQYVQLLRDELNIKSINIKVSTSESKEITGELDNHITTELQLEGELREMLRIIQSERKNRGLKQNQTVSVTVPSKFKLFNEEIKRSVNAGDIQFGGERVVVH